MNETFKGRCRLTSLQGTKSFTYPIGEDGKADTSRTIGKPAVMVTFSSVKDGDEEDSMFGALTPSGEFKLTIANEDVARELVRAWSEWVTREEVSPAAYPGYTDQPKYEVTFRRIG